MFQGLMKLVRPLALILATGLLAGSVSAQQMESAKLDAPLPTAPMVSGTPASDNMVSAPTGNALIRAATPQKPEEHKFFDKQQMIALYVHAGVRTADTIETCHTIANGATEMWIPMQSCAGIAAWQAGSVGVVLGIGWLFHKTGHHKLERITPWVGTGASAAGLTKSAFNIH
jgi:hypothetical protein